MPANIGTRECGKRLTFGAVALVIAAAAAGGMIAFGTGRHWRLAMLAPWYVAMLGFFQARDKT